MRYCRSVYAAISLSCVGAVAIVGCTARPAQKNDYITISPPVRVPAQFQRGSDILLQCRDAYSRIKEFDGTVELSSKASWGAQTIPENRKPGGLRFSSPDKLRFDYFDSNGFRDVVEGSGTDYIFEGSSLSAKHYSTAREPLEVALGVSLTMSGWIPAILCDVRFENDGVGLPHGDILAGFATKARFDGDEEVDGANCHRIVCDRETGTWTLWVDADEMLLRKIHEFVSPAQMAFRENIGRGSRSGRITSMDFVQAIRWSQVEFGPPRFQELPIGSANSDASH